MCLTSDEYSWDQKVPWEMGGDTLDGEAKPKELKARTLESDSPEMEQRSELTNHLSLQGTVPVVAL